MTRFTVLVVSFLTSVCLWAQQVAVPPAEAPTAAPLAEDPAIPDDGVRVAVLGYHEFAENLPETAMRIRTSKFRAQMQTLRQLGMTVISMDDFVAWKKGDKSIPAKSVLLTFDDGWKSVYTDALPILREFKYPFTLYLYKNYVDGGGRALTLDMIREMIRSGATLGSHSVSHPYPATVKKFRSKGPDAFDAFLRKEIGESKRFLEAKFAVKATTFAYPGGFTTEEMFPLCEEFGYTHCFTVVPGKVKRSTPDTLLPRYIILGNHDPIFQLATSFGGPQSPGGGGIAGAITGLVQTTPYPVTPEPGAIVNSRLPLISADLATVGELDPATLVMCVSGFGQVPARFDATTGKLAWQVNRRLRQPTCQVSVQWKTPAGKSFQPALRWSFQIDRHAAYLPDGG